MKIMMDAKQKSVLSHLRTSLSRNNIERRFIIFIFLAPSIIAFAVIRYIPLLQSFYYSFFKYDLVNPPGRFVGFKNYINALSSELFWMQFGNTLILFGFGILFGFFTPIIQALLLNEVTKGRSLFRYLYILPAGIPGIAAIALWKFIWLPDGGLANFITSTLGLGTYDWIYSENLVKLCLRFPGILGGGLAILIYMVAINNIPAEIYEAAKVDGATAWQRMWRITLPNITYMIQVQFLLALTGSLLAFDDVFIMTQGGPGYASTTLVLGIYRKSFQEQNFGQGIAMSIIILLFTLVFTITQLKIQNNKK